MGRFKLIETPEKLLEIFEAYKDHVKNNPREIQKALQSGKIGIEKVRVPYTMEGFEVFCFNKYSDVHHYFDNTDGRYEDFRTICSHIKKEIRQDQIEGGMVGQYNPSITQRLNNLVERTDVTSNEETINEISVTIHKKGLIED